MGWAFFLYISPANCTKKRFVFFFGAGTGNSMPRCETTAGLFSCTIQPERAARHSAPHTERSPLHETFAHPRRRSGLFPGCQLRHCRHRSGGAGPVGGGHDQHARCRSRPGACWQGTRSVWDSTPTSAWGGPSPIPPASPSLCTPEGEFKPSRAYRDAAKAGEDFVVLEEVVEEIEAPVPAVQGPDRAGTRLL